jgi:hypothetical protein
MISTIAAAILVLFEAVFAPCVSLGVFAQKAFQKTSISVFKQYMRILFGFLFLN